MARKLPRLQRVLDAPALFSVAWTTTLCSLVALALAGPLSRLILGFDDPVLMDCAILGLWAFTNLEVAYAQLRVDERARTYVSASAANVLMADASVQFLNEALDLAILKNLVDRDDGKVATLP